MCAGGVVHGEQRTEEHFKKPSRCPSRDSHVATLRLRNGLVYTIIICRTGPFFAEVLHIWVVGFSVW